MFARLVADSFTRRPRRKLLTTAALALGMAVATAALSVSLDVGDRLAREFRSLGANLLVTPQADSLPLEIGGVDYRPVNAGAYLPEADLPKLKTIFWRNNIVAFAPVLEALVIAEPDQMHMLLRGNVKPDVRLIGTWAYHLVSLPEGGSIETGVVKTNPWWHIEGSWFRDNELECVVGRRLAAERKIKVGDEFPVYEVKALNPPLPVTLGPLAGVLEKAFPAGGGPQIRTNSESTGQPLGTFLRDRIVSLDQRGLRADQVELPHKLRVTGILNTGGDEDDSIVTPIALAQQIAEKPGQYRKLYVSALTKPEDDFGRRDPETLSPKDFDRWYCTPYVSSIALQVKQALPGSDVRVIRRVAEGEGVILTKVRALLWLVTFAALLAAALAVGASSAASVIERRTEIGLMKALGAGSGTVGFLLAAEQLLLAFVGGGIGYSLGTLLARVVGEKIFGVAPAPSLLLLVVVIALATVVTLLGSAIPLRRASRYEPAPILRGE